MGATPLDLPCMQAARMPEGPARSLAYAGVMDMHPAVCLQAPCSSQACPCAQEAHLQAVPLWRVKLKHMARALRHYRGRFNTIVAFRPTGWAHSVGELPYPDPTASSAMVAFGLPPGRTPQVPCWLQCAASQGDARQGTSQEPCRPACGFHHIAACRPRQMQRVCCL